jgi:hypothetical protein
MVKSKYKSTNTMKKTSLTLGALFIVVILSFGQTNEGTETNEDGARIEFNETTHNYGTIEYKGNGNCKFVFENTGNKPLVLNNVRSSCGCTTPRWPKNKPVNPGETDTINVRYNTGIVGNFTKSIHVYSNAVNKSPIRLTIKGKVVRNKED